MSQFIERETIRHSRARPPGLARAGAGGALAGILRIALAKQHRIGS